MLVVPQGDRNQEVEPGRGVLDDVVRGTSGTDREAFSEFAVSFNIEWEGGIVDQFAANPFVEQPLDGTLLSAEFDTPLNRQRFANHAGKCLVVFDSGVDLAGACGYSDTG